MPRFWPGTENALQTAHRENIRRIRRVQFASSLCDLLQNNLAVLDYGENDTLRPYIKRTITIHLKQCLDCEKNYQGMGAMMKSLSLYHDRELDEADHPALTQHLEKCRQCPRILKEYQKLNKLVRQYGR